MDLGLSGRIALVAAASQGLGKASAAALAREGARVAILSRRPAELDQAAKDIGAALAVACDLSQAASIVAAVAKLIFNTAKSQAIHFWGVIVSKKS